MTIGRAQGQNPYHSEKRANPPTKGATIGKPRKSNAASNANDDAAGFELRAEKILQRNIEVAWGIDRIFEVGFDDKGKPKLKYDELRAEMRAEFPKTLTSDTIAGKRVTPARKAAMAIHSSLKDPFKARLYDELQQLLREAWSSHDLELVRKIIADFRKMFGLDDAEKHEHSGSITVIDPKGMSPEELEAIARGCGADTGE